MISDDEGINGIPIFIIGCVSSSSSPLFTLGNRIEGKPSFSMQPRCLYPNCALFTRWWIAKIVLSTMIVVLAQTSIVNSHWIWALFPAVFHSKWFTVRNNQVVFGLLESVDEDVDFRIILIKPVSLFPCWQNQEYEQHCAVILWCSLWHPGPNSICFPRAFASSVLLIYSSLFASIMQGSRNTVSIYRYSDGQNPWHRHQVCMSIIWFRS